MLRKHPIVIEHLRRCEAYENILGDIKDAVVLSDIKLDEKVIDIFMKGEECEFKTYEEYDEFITMMEYLNVNLRGKYSGFYEQRREKYAI